MPEQRPRKAPKSASGHFDATDLQKNMSSAENRVDQNNFTIDAHTSAGFCARHKAMGVGWR